MKVKKILGTLEAWENRDLGADEQFAAPAPSPSLVELDAQSRLIEKQLATNPE